MKIQVKIIKENPDGSANAQVDFDKAGLECLVQHGLISLITQAIDVYKIKPETAQTVIERAKKLVEGEDDEPVFTGNIASNKPKIGRPRSKKQDA
jgi:hypothetical protein